MFSSVTDSDSYRNRMEKSSTEPVKDAAVNAPVSVVVLFDGITSQK